VTVVVGSQKTIETLLEGLWLTIRRNGGQPFGVRRGDDVIPAGLTHVWEQPQ
jgi:hypothetical protein